MTITVAGESIMPNQKIINLNHIRIGNREKMVLLGGMNVLESAQLADEVVAHYREVTTKLNIPYIFKASFDKANRSSVNSFRGPGLEKGLQIFADLKSKYRVPIITDVHEPWQAKEAAAVVDIIDRK